MLINGLGGDISTSLTPENDRGDIVENKRNSTGESQDTSEPPCQSYHSQEWLSAGGDRISNNAEGMDHNYVSRLMEPNLLQHVSKFTDQTICHPKGNFGSGSVPPAKEWNSTDTELVQAWSVKLIYLSIHALLHEPAYEEFRIRKQELERQSTSSSSSSSTPCLDLPLFDYECKGAKYLVSNIPSEGLGASVRMGAMGVIMMALATNRIPLFVSNSSYGPEYIVQPWIGSSCSRGDYQCVFHPLTPCTIRQSELLNATVLTSEDVLPIQRDGTIKDEWSDQKILILPTCACPIQFRKSLDIVKNRIHAKAMELISRSIPSDMQDISESRLQQLDVLTKAAQLIVANIPENNDERYEEANDLWCGQWT